MGLAGLAGNAAAQPARFVVGANTPAATRAAERAAEASGRVIGLGRFGWAVAGRFSPQALEQLARRTDVRYVEPDEMLHAISHDGTELEWGVDRIDAEVAHTAGQTGAGGHVAILDTGIDPDHPDLEANIDRSLSRSFVNRFWSGNSWEDDNGHGTHCAGIAAAVSDGSGVVGVAPQATLHAIKVLDANGSGYSSEIADGLTWVANRLPISEGVVASMSFGSGTTLSVVKEACAYAYEQGVLLVAAAGNSGPCDNCVSFPARTNTVVAVGATNANDGLATFSATGKPVELVAPGVNIHSTTPGGDYASWSGTSMACPHVAGVAALLMANGQYAHATNVVFDGTNDRLVDDAYLHPGGARGRLRETAELLSGLVSDFGGASNEQGFGLVDAERAVLDGSGGGSDGGSGDTTAPTITNPTAIDTVDDDGTVGDGTVNGGETVAVSATVTDSGTGVVSVTADASAFGSGTVTLSNGGSGDDYAGSFVVDTTNTADGTYVVPITAVDGANNTSTTGTNSLTIDTSGSGGGGPLAIDSFTAVSGAPRNPHAEIDMAWQVSGSPDSVTLVLTGSDGSGADERWGVGASGTRSYVEKHTSGTYTVTLTATNGSETVTATEILDA